MQNEMEISSQRECTTREAWQGTKVPLTIILQRGVVKMGETGVEVVAIEALKHGSRT